jgi:Cu(I)/Ag(I) efflux system membrane fusion protein
MNKETRFFAVLSASLAAVIIIMGALWLQHATGGFPFSGGGAPTGTKYTCPMHPTYISDRPGECPICGMDLVPVDEAGETGTGGGVEGYTTVLISPTKQQLIGLKTTKVETRDVVKTIRTVGMVELDQSRVYHVHTKFKGWIEDVYVPGEGDTVYAGQPLVSIYSPELYTTQDEYLLALRGARELEDSSFSGVAEGSERLLEAARRRLKLWDVSDSEIARLERTGEPLEDIKLYSPYSGYVARTMAEPGMYVQPGTELFAIADTSSVWVLADIYESELPFIKPGIKATIELPFSDAGPIEGTVSHVYPYVEGSSRTVKARFEFPNPKGALLPMMYADVKAEIDLGERLVIPEEAILDTGGRKIVFVALEDGHMEPREITVLTEASGFAVVQDGLEAGETVVTSGNFLIDSESQLKAALAGMGGGNGLEKGEETAPADHSAHVH